jgi:hypothetical protein
MVMLSGRRHHRVVVISTAVGDVVGARYVEDSAYPLAHTLSILLDHLRDEGFAHKRVSPLLENRCKSAKKRRLLQLRILCLCLFEDGDVGIGVFPEREEILIGGTGFDRVALHGIGTGQTEAG